MIRLLWVAPNLNHYKARLLSRLSEDSEIKLTLFSGMTLTQEGHQSPLAEMPFEMVQIPVFKKKFSFSLLTFTTIHSILRNRCHDLVLMPAEKKFFPLIIFLFLIKNSLKFRLISYNHPIILSQRHKVSRIDLIFSRILFSFYDHIIFYTESSMESAVQQRLIEKRRASFANNTLDTREINRHQRATSLQNRPHTLLFIGRLLESKGVTLLLDYHDRIKKALPEIRLIIIGDGPLAEEVQEASAKDSTIRWVGGLSDEAAIAEQMEQAHAVFVPGESGLSVVHAFAYGKPYLTTAPNNFTHGPELSYLRDGTNGLFLRGNREKNAERIVALLKDQKRYTEMCCQVQETMHHLGVENWVTQMRSAMQLVSQAC